MARSNRQLTQFAVDKLREFLVYGPSGCCPEGHCGEMGNTKVEVVRCTCAACATPRLVISLFNEPIMAIVTSPINERVVAGIIVYTGNFYDSKGRPSRTTRERLNGLLDALGTAKFIPEGIRVFIRQDNEQCCVGKDDACKALDAGHDKVLLLAHPTDIVFS